MISLHPRRIRRVVASLAGLTAASVLLAACLYAQIPQPTTVGRTADPDTSDVSAELLDFYGQALQWESCGTGFDCTEVTVPEDWDDPTAGEISLAVVRYSAEGGNPIGSLLTNPGGPGASGVALIRDSVTFAVGEELRENFDIIGFDPRGVGDSTAVRCYEDAQMDEYLFDIPNAERGTDAWYDELDASNAAFSQACDANSELSLENVTTEFAARDMDVLRAVLGDTSLNYLGYSYGTFLGATYAKLYPERVGRVVLDGAVDPAAAGTEVSETQAIGFESALRAYMESCLADDGCPFRGTVDDAMKDLSVLLASVDARPLPASDGRLMGADALVTAIVTALYAQDSWTYLTQALAAVLQGDPNFAFFLTDTYYNRVDGEYKDNSTEAFRAYNCIDYPDDVTDEQEAASKARIAAEAPTIAPYWEGADPCESWPFPPSGERGEIVAAGTAPIVVVGTTNDPATPYEWSVALADQLASGVLVTRVGEGHTGYNKGNACVDNAVETYLIDGTVPEDGLTCE